MLINTALKLQWSHGTYRLPYANNVTFKVNRDHLTNSPSKTRLDLGGTAGGGGGTYPIVAGPCSGDPCVNDIVLPAKIIRGTEAHIAANTVDTGNNNISLDTYASLALYAGNKVTLRPGFKALSKSYLRAAIQPCFNPP